MSGVGADQLGNFGSAREKSAIESGLASHNARAPATNQPAGDMHRYQESTDLEGTVSFLITTATALEQRVAETASSRGFDDAVAAFTGLLKTVIDLPPRTTGGDVVAALRAHAERVIAHIERRLEGRADRLPSQVALAQEIDQIQQALENIDRSHRPHPAAAAPTPHAVSCTRCSKEKPCSATFSSPRI